MVDARDNTHKLLSKNRWRTKFLNADDSAAKSKANHDDDVNDFLKPSTDKAQAHKQAVAAAFLANAKPRIDVARAQRWPAASDIVNSAAGRSPNAGAMKTGSRKKAVSVSFARTQPDIIGEGGDECEEPSIEVSRRKSNSLSRPDKDQVHTHQDDMNLGTQTFDHANSMNKEAERKGIVTRTLTSRHELSPPLQKKMEMGRINTHASPPPPPTRGLGPMGLGERPRSLQRAPTGFDTAQDSGAGRPSLDSTYSHDSDNISPVVPKKTPTLPPTAEEDPGFRPIQRTATGWSEKSASSDREPPPPPPPHLPELGLKDDDSPLESVPNKYLQSEPTDPNSFSARLIHKMRADEGRALHDAAARRAAEKSAGDSGSDSDSKAASANSSTFNVGTPPTQFNIPLAGKTPPRLPGRAGPQASSLPRRDSDVEYKAFSAGPAPGPPSARRPMRSDVYAIDTNTRPVSPSSSQYTLPSATSRTRASPPNRIDPASATSTTSNLPMPPDYERREYKDPKDEAPPVPPAHRYAPYQRVVPANDARPDSRQDSERSRAPGRSDTKSQAELAFADFSERVQHMKGIFVLTAQLAGPLYDHTPTQWLRVAIWWFLRGRAGMETLIRSRPKGEPHQERLMQPHVDLAKAWWIVTEVLPNHTGLRKYGDQRMENQAALARDAGDHASADIYEAYDSILHNLKMLLGSMQRHQSMPPTQALIQGQDQAVWVEYPKFAPDAQSVLTGTASKSVLANGSGQRHPNPSMIMPLGDTKSDFCYFRMFANVSLSTDDPNSDRIPLPAVISVLRPKDDYRIKLTVCSQTELINIVVGSNPDGGPTWRDMSWRPKSRGLTIPLRHNFNLLIDLSEQDFRGLWSIVDHTNRVESNLREHTNERLSAKLYLRDVSYVDSSNPSAFPPGRVPGCKLLVFRKFERSSEGTGKRKLHRGYRLVVVTGTKVRTLSCVNHEMGTNQEPMNFEYTKDPADNAPGMTLRFKEEAADKRRKLCTLNMIFNDVKERNELFGTFTSMNQGEDEAVFAQVPLKGFSIESADPAEGFSQSGRAVLERFKWLEAKVLNQDPEAAGLESAPTVMSESLRIVCRHNAGIISDRMNLGPGELLVRLPTNGSPELSLLRNPQYDMSVAIDPSHTDKDVPDALADLLRTLTNASTIRTLTFNSFSDLHAFQLAVTGFHVKFDGIASTFSVSRRRMVVPIYKQWTANTIRIQVVVQDNIVQLLAFFEDFSHADAMNFQVKSMDVFEKTEKGGKACVRLVDAKFALPVEERRGEGKMGKEEGRISGWAGMKRRFVCLDQIEYPGEHDDILIAFDSVDTRDRFAEALPAVTQVGRKFTVRRKI
ncbi:uncharacterized protein EI97DRAFT_223932 [Westerdykella ornata]|uniref:Uncharacterized protein n=1 Tax=Westerdykella ornata TaxID=318751 RepID=A0A6A6JRP7_WESOR|nr:uncharacterized protein EI97DRAFT_223932 [Westerdykella ornata]KAF2278944.1 hypothetical protein EI97DRAFT_223932 [Westerdykella ornata]